MHWLPNRRAACRTSSGSRTAAELIDTLSAPALKSIRISSRLRIPPPTVSGMKQTSAVRADDVQQDRPALVTGGDIQENQLVGTFAIITRSHGDRIARILEIDEVGPLDHTAVVDVEARDDPLGQHAPFSTSCGPSATPAGTTSFRPPPSSVPRFALYSIEES